MRVWRWWFVLYVLLLPAVGVRAQVATTTVSDTVYRADGTPAAGTVLVSWHAFTTAGGSAVAAGSTSVAIGAGGVVTLQLAPNAGATPMGSYYTAVLHLDDGTVAREFWVVPVTAPGGGAVTIGAIRSSVLPASVAMQTASKAYVDTAIAAAVTGHPLDSSPYVLKAGDTMTGPLGLPADPVTATEAADKNYVDENVSAVGAGLGQKVSKVPTATQVVVQPAGTELDVNILNGTVNPETFQSGPGGNGIANALAQPVCASGCEVRADATYSGGETLPGVLPGATHVEDDRGGSLVEEFADPEGTGAGAVSAGEQILLQARRSVVAAKTAMPGIQSYNSFAVNVQQAGLAGGNNLYPEDIETPPYFKSTYSAMSLAGVYNTAGQHVLVPEQTHCYGVGDCLIGSQLIVSSGGFRDSADEGTHPFDLSVAEDTAVFTGTCTTGCTTGATTLGTTATTAPGTEGDGRFLLDTAAADVLSTGAIVNGGIATVPFAQVTFSGTNLPVSVFLQAAAAATSQATDIAPGTVVVPIRGSGVVAGFATNTAALPATSGIACVVDPSPDGSSVLPNYETAPYTAVDGTDIRLTLRKVHRNGFTISVGGLCGYGLEQVADTVGGIRQVFPIVGAFSATQLYYAASLTLIVGNSGFTSGFLNLSVPVLSAARSGGVVTVTAASPLPVDVDGLQLTVSGAADPSYNGTFAVTTTGGQTLTYADAGPDSTTSGGTLSYLNGGFRMYPMAEVVSAMDPATGTVDGTLTLSPNTVPWAQGDTVEMPHYYQMLTKGDVQVVAQTMPRPLLAAPDGKEYQGVVGPGITGYLMNNRGALSQYLGHGGTHGYPDRAFQVEGGWTNDIEVEAGQSSVLRVHCNTHGCGRWDSAFYLYQMDSATGVDGLYFQPQSDTEQLLLGGAGYTFSPSAFTAATINVGTLNATAITGGVSGGSITSGTVAAARLPVFGPSGVNHAPGVVPDPGATAGTTRFLREDGTFAVPAGTGGGGGGGASGTVAITGGTIDGTVIGGSTAAAASVTALVASTLAVTGTGSGSNLFGGAAAITGGAAGDLPTVFATSATAGQYAHQAALQSQANNDARTAFVFNAQIGGKQTNIGEFGTGLGATTTQDYYVYLYNAGGWVPFYAADAGVTGKYVGINNTSPTHTLDVGGTLNASGAVTAAGYQETLTTPASSAAACAAGQFTDDANYHYVCVAQNTWRRVALASF